MKLYAVRTKTSTNPHLKPGEYWAMCEADWGPSPTATQVARPHIFTELVDAEKLIARVRSKCVGGVFEIVTFAEQS